MANIKVQLANMRIADADAWTLTHSIAYDAVKRR
jgi:hypothetical protein